MARYAGIPHTGRSANSSRVGGRTRGVRRSPCRSNVWEREFAGRVTRMLELREGDGDGLGVVRTDDERNRLAVPDWLSSSIADVSNG